MAELFVTGQIVSASGFGLPSIFCKYSFETGSTLAASGTRQWPNTMRHALVRPLHFPLPSNPIPSL